MFGNSASTLLVHVHVGKVTALGVLCCFALFVCLTLLASFFLPSHLSFKNMYIQYGLATSYEAFAFHTCMKNARNACEIFANAFCAHYPFVNAFYLHLHLLRVSSLFGPRSISGYSQLPS